MLPSRFEKFVDKVEKNAPSYTEDDWNNIFEEYDKLNQKYDEAYSKLSSEDRERINKAKGRYIAIIAKYTVHDIIDSSKEAIKDASNIIKGAADGIKSILNELGLGEDSDLGE